MTLRVAHVVDGLCVGGAEHLVAVAARTLAPYGVETSVLSLRADGDTPLARALADQGVEVVWLPSRRKRSFLDPERLLEVRRALRRGRYDVVQSHLQYANVIAGIASAGSDTPLLATLHHTAREPWRYERERELIESAVLRRRATRAVAVGWEVAAAHRRRLGRLPIDIVPNPVTAPGAVADDVRDAVRAEVLGDNEGPLILAVGRLEHVKGFDDLMTAFANVASQQPGAVLAIAGRGSLGDTLEGHARRCGNGRIRMLGERSDVPALLAAADLFVMSSHSEGLPLALLEAMAAGVPVVATRVGDVPRVLGSSGLLVPPRRPDELADAMAKAIATLDWRTEHAGLVRDQVLADYSEARWAEQMNSIYRAVANDGDGERPLKLAVLTHGYRPRIGGIEVQRAATMPLVAELGVEPHVFTRAVPGAPDRELLDGVDVRRVAAVPAAIERSSHVSPEVKRALGSALWSARTLWHVARLRPDVIHADEVLSTARVALAAGRVLHRPVVVFAHASGSIGEIERNVRSFMGRRLLDAIRRRARLVVSVSDEIDEEFNRLGIEAERRLILENGVDVQRFTPAAADERAELRTELGLGSVFVAVFVGRLAPEKRLDRALAVWPSVTAAVPGAELVIVGAGPEARALRAAAPPGVRFVDATTDVRPYLRAADVFLLTSEREGLPVALLEAQACGVPAIAGDVGAIRRVVEHGANGLVVDEGDLDALQEAVIALACDPLRCRAMGAEARRVAITRFSLDDVARALRRIYVSVAIDPAVVDGRTRATSGLWTANEAPCFH